MSPLPWVVRLQDVADAPTKVAFAATPEERGRVAQMLDAVSCASLAAKLTIGGPKHGRYRVQGSIVAVFERLCVVSLEPFEEALEIAVDVEFWPRDQLGEAREVDIDNVDEDDPEPIDNGAIEAGRLVYEMIAGAIDPHPRKPGEEMERLSSGDGDDAPVSGPFADLASLKDGR